MINLLGRPCANCLELIKQAQPRIERLDAEVILAHLLGVTRTELYIYEKDIPWQIIERFNVFVSKRASGVPVQYIIGKTEFMGLEFIVTQDVLIPRPETELLVERAIELIQSADRGPRTAAQPRVLDLGTGSGNIAISLTKFSAGCKIMASDVSRQALSISVKNAQLNAVSGKIRFILSDLFKNLPKKTKFDIIISNPPYVPSDELDTLEKELRFEPRIALAGGADGLDFCRVIIKESRRFLKRGGKLMLEFGFNQADEIEDLLLDNTFNNIKFILDYNSIKRAVVAEWIG